MELVDLMRGAQQAMDRNDYGLAAAACQHVLDSRPSCLAATRMLGEACLEQGKVDEGMGYFERALSLDPLNVVIRLGLGVAAEERNDLRRAYSFYLNAWEINPALDRVRDELVRIRGALGTDERLHPSGIGLAGIYARSGQYARAVHEWRTILAAEPDSRRARTSLAEVLWRSGDDTAAAVAAREALRGCEENARALAILADIEHRRGGPAAIEAIDRYQAIDPLGEIAMLLAEWREGADLSFLQADSVPVPDFDFAQVAFETAEAAISHRPAVSLAGGHVAAPDLWDTLLRDMETPGASPEVASAPPGVDIELPVEPFNWSDDGATAALFNPWDQAPPVVPEIVPGVEETLAAMAAPQQNGAGSIVPLSAPSPVMPAAASPPVAASPPAPPAADPFVTADGRVDLTVGWDEIDRALADATPSFDAASPEMDALMAELGVEGIAPFAVSENRIDDAAWEPITADELVAESMPAPRAAVVGASAAVVETVGAMGNPPPVASVATPEAVTASPAEPPAYASHFSAGAATVDTGGNGTPFEGDAPWSLDDEVLSGIPRQGSSGYTDLLRHIDIEVPTTVGEPDAENAFENPDAAGAPLQFEDLLAVTSKDGTAPLGTPESALHDENGGSAASEGANLDLIADALPTAVEVAPAEPATELDALLVGLGEVQPFDFSDASAPVPVDAVMDFTEINDERFDPSKYAPPADPVMDWGEADAAGAEPTAAVVEDVAESSIAGVDELELPAHDIAPVEPEATPLAAIESEPDAIPEESEAEPVATPAPVAANESEAAQSAENGRSQVVWPSFVSHTSALMDRASQKGSVFSRLRIAKTGSDEPRVFHVQPAVAAAEAVVAAAPVTAPAAKKPTSSLDPEIRERLMTMRLRLIDDEGAAEEIARAVEVLNARGVHDPLACRVLGEAYLKLGRTEQAAAQFRQAMLTRRRAR